MSDIQYDYEKVIAFLKTYGKFNRISPITRKIVERGKRKACFSNSLKYSILNFEDVGYIEGLAGSNFVENPLEKARLHGWNVFKNMDVFEHCFDKTPIYFDKTWTIHGQCSGLFYYGVEICPHFAHMVISLQFDKDRNKPGGYSVLTYEPLLNGELKESEWRPHDYEIIES